MLKILFLQDLRTFSLSFYHQSYSTLSISLHIGQKLRWGIIGLSLLVLLLLAIGYGLWRSLESQYQIQYLSFSFDRSGQLKVKNLRISQAESFSFTSDSLAVRWHWMALLRGQLEMENLYVKGLFLDLHPTASESENESVFFPTRCRDIILEDARFFLQREEDTTELHLASLRISNASINKQVIVDSLVLQQAQLAYHYFPQQAKRELPSDTISFAVSDLPSFQIDHLGIHRGRINYQSKEQSHQLDNLELNLNGWKSKDLLNFRLNQLAFTFQDSLDFDVGVEHGEVSDPLKTRLQDIELQFPGLALHIGSLKFRNEEGPEADLQLLPSSLSFGALKRWYPDIMLSLQPGISDDSFITFAGNLSFNKDQLSFDSLSVGLLEKTRTDISGKLDWSRDTLQFDFAFTDLQTNNTDLHSLLRYQAYNDFFSWPSAATGKATLRGSPQYLDISSTLSTPEGKLEINSLTSIKNEDSLYYSIDLESKSLLLDQLLDYLPLEIPQAQISLSINGLLTEDERQDYLQMKIGSEHLTIEGRKSGDLSFNYYSNNHYDSLWGQINDPMIAMDLQGAIYSGDTSSVSFSGQFSKLSSKFISDQLPLQTLETQYEGTFHWQEDNLSTIYLNTRDAILKNEDSAITEVPDVMWSFRQEGAQISTAIRSADLTVFSLVSDTSFYTLDTETEDWLVKLPNVKASFSLGLDSISMVNLTDQPLALSLNKLDIKKDGETLRMYLDAPHLQYADTHLRQLTGELEANAEQMKAYLSLNSTENNYLPLDSLRIDISQSNDFYQLDVGGLIAELHEPLSFGLDLHAKDSSYMLRLDEERPLMLAGDIWQVKQSEGLVFDHGFSLQAGDLSLRRENTQLTFNTQSDGSIDLQLDALQLSDIFFALDTSRAIDGNLFSSLSYQPKTGEISWQAQVNDILLGTTKLGNIHSEGAYQEDSLATVIALEGKHANADIHLLDKGSGLEFTADISELDFSLLESTDLLDDDISLRGKLSAFVRGKADSLNNASGYITTSDSEVTISDISSSFYLPGDSVYLQQGKLQFNDFTIYDVDKNPLSLSGSIILLPELFADLEINGDAFRLLDNSNSTANISGQLFINTKLSLTGGMDNLTAFGNLDILPGAYLRYLYQGSIGMPEASSIVTFVEFDELDRKNEIFGRSSGQIPINWNVNLNILNTNLEIVLNELSQENIKLSGGGEIRLRGESSPLPTVYGNLTARNGRAIIFPPMVPDLDLNIQQLSLNWQGDPMNPTISFEGVETIKASPRGLSPTLKDRYDLVDFKVFLQLKDTKIDNLSPAFDLQSTDGSVNTYLQGLGPEQREKYAIDLLVFGNIASESVAGAPRALEAVVSKMNEIASRNFNKTDVSFGVVQYQKPGEGPVASTKTSVNYKISRQLFHNRMFLSIGGNMGSYSASPNTHNTHLIGNLEVGYRLRRQPEISLIGARKFVYEGVIDGDIVRSSIGLKFRRNYPDWYSVFLGEKEEE